MQTLAGIAHKRRQSLFNIQVNVFVVEIPVEISSRDLGDYRCHSALDLRQVGFGNDALSRQHARVRERAAYVLAPHALVEKNRCRIALDEVGDGFGEAARPGGLRVGRGG
jgi:hypothetical protein